MVINSCVLSRSRFRQNWEAEPDDKLLVSYDFTHARPILSRLSLFYAVENGFLRLGASEMLTVDDKQTLVGSLMTRGIERIRADTEAGKCGNILRRKPE